MIWLRIAVPSQWYYVKNCNMVPRQFFNGLWKEDEEPAAA